jgi:phosphoenolpyruvate-protein phosphotransferase (PTS system enzyme I)
MAERRYVGRIASPGLARGPLVHLPTPHLQVPHRRGHLDPVAERAQLVAGMAVARAALAELAAGADDMAGEILGFQLAMLDDPALAEAAFDDIAGGVDAATAWRAALDPQIALFQADDDSYFKARAADLEDLRDRVHAAVDGAPSEETALPAGAIVVAHDLTPSRFLAFDWASLGGAALANGSAASHVAMLARARGVPLLVGLGNLATAGVEAVLDAFQGHLVVAPEPSTAAAYADRFAVARTEAAAAAERLSRPARTADDRSISVMINVDDPDAVPDDLLRASDGVGLLRSEFLFMNRPDLPDETTQYQAYRRLLERLGGRPLVLRTLDIGGDKPLPGLDLPHEANPFLGLRGLRLCLARPEIFRPQLRAAIRAAAHGPLSIMLPMVSRAAEVEAARVILEWEADDLGLPAPPLGIMIETPAAALALDTMPVDFASIGSSDLTQYVMAAARDGIGPVADLFDPLDPAVLRLIGLVVETAAARGLPLSVCGEMASDQVGLEALLARGVTRLSVAPAALGRVKLWISRYSS